MMRLFAIVLVLLTASIALAHDHWINNLRLTDPASGEWCCNHIDCAAEPAGGVTERSGGYLVGATGEVIPSTRVIWQSKDGAWWRCRYLGGERAGKTRCLIGPPPAS